MHLISEAEQQSSLSTILLISPFDKSYQTYLKFFKRSSLRASASGFGIQIILLNLRFAAESSSFGRLVAPITRTSPLLGLLMPSIRTRNYVFNLLDASFSFSDLAVSIESISSINMIEGASFSAAKNILFIAFYDQPTNLFIIEEADKAKNVQPDYLANALQIYVFPFPGGPQSKIPFGGALIPVQRSGLWRGRITAYSSMTLTSPSPTISLKDTSKFLIITSRTAGSSIFYKLGFLNIGFFLSTISFIWFSSYFFGCSIFFNYCTLMLLKEFELGKPNPGGGLSFEFFFQMLFAYACDFKAKNLSILDLSCWIVSLEVASATASLNTIIILSQHRIAYSQFPSNIQFSAFFENYLAIASFYIQIISKQSLAIIITFTRSNRQQSIL